MKKYCSMLLLVLCGILYMVFALGSYEDKSFEKIVDVKGTFAEQTIYNNHDVIIKVTGSSFKPTTGFVIDFYIENNSNHDLSFNVHSYGVNGIMGNGKNMRYSCCW